MTSDELKPEMMTCGMHGTPCPTYQRVWRTLRGSPSPLPVLSNMVPPLSAGL